MPRPHLKISVPKPCSESWVEMNPQGAGRHCQSCSTTVVDFTKFTDQQLLAYLQHNPGQKCGRFAESQLERPVYLEPAPKPGIFYKVAAAVGLLLGISAQAQAQIQMEHPVPTNEVVPQKIQGPLKSGEVVTGEVVTNNGGGNAAVGGALVISGKLIDAETLEPIPFGNVVVKGTKYYCMTDIEGRFKIALSDTFQLEEFILITPNVGYETTESILKLKSLPLNTDVILKSSVKVNGMVVTTYTFRKTPGYYARSFWWRTKNFLGIREKGFVTGNLDETETAEKSAH